MGHNSIACLRKVVAHPKHFIRASKPSYCVIKLATATKISCFVIMWAVLVKIFRCLLNIAVKPGNVSYIQISVFYNTKMSLFFSRVLFCITLSFLESDFNSKSSLEKVNTVQYCNTQKHYMHICIYTVNLFVYQCVTCSENSKFTFV